MRKPYLILLLFFAYATLFAQTKTEKADALLTAYARQYKFNGSALVTQNGHVILEKGYGFKNAKDSLLNDANTIFQIGSITKQFTAAIILKLQEQKKLDVKDKLSKYFPDYPKGDSITIENLLTHTSGIYNYTNDGKFMNSSATRPSTPEKMLALFKDKPLDFSPGTRWSYSNSGYMLLGYIIEKVTGQPYETVVRKYIFQPLVMTHSGFDFVHLSGNDKATGYLVYTDKTKLAATPVDSSVSYAAGAIYSTVGDLYKWHRGLMTGRIIGNASLQKAYTPFMNKYGYGWAIDSMYGKRLIMHGGGIFGFNTHIARITEDDVCVILLNNMGNAILSDITARLLAIVYDKPYELPKEKKEIAVPATILQQYAGEYEIAGGIAVKFFVDSDGAFKTQVTGQPVLNLYAETETRFFLKVADATVEFIRNSEGVYDKVVLWQNGKRTECKRIK